MESGQFFAATTSPGHPGLCDTDRAMEIQMSSTDCHPGGQWCELWNGSSKAALVRISCCFWNVFCFIRESFQFLVMFCLH